MVGLGLETGSLVAREMLNNNIMGYMLMYNQTQHNNSMGDSSLSFADSTYIQYTVTGNHQGACSLGWGEYMQGGSKCCWREQPWAYTCRSMMQTLCASCQKATKLHPLANLNFNSALYVLVLVKE